MRILRKDLTIDIGPPIVGTIEIVSLLELWDPLERAVSVVEVPFCAAISLHTEIVWASVSADTMISNVCELQQWCNINDSPEVCKSNCKVVDPNASLLVT